MPSGRPTAFTTKKKEGIFSDSLSFFRESEKDPPKTDQIWVEIKQHYQLPQNVTIGAIYTAMLNKYRDLMDKKNPKLN